MALPPTDGGRLARAAVELGRCGRFDSSRRHSDSGRRCGGLQHHPGGVGRGSAGPVRCGRNCMITSFAPRCSGALFRCGEQPRECRYHSASPLPGTAAAAPHQVAVHRIEPLPANTSGIGEHLRHWRTPLRWPIRYAGQRISGAGEAAQAGGEPAAVPAETWPGSGEEQRPARAIWVTSAARGRRHPALLEGAAPAQEDRRWLFDNVQPGCRTVSIGGAQRCVVLPSRVARSVAAPGAQGHDEDILRGGGQMCVGVIDAYPLRERQLHDASGRTAPFIPGE